MTEIFWISFVWQYSRKSFWQCHSLLYHVIWYDWWIKQLWYSSSLAFLSVGSSLLWSIPCGCKEMWKIRKSTRMLSQVLVLMFCDAETAIEKDRKKLRTAYQKRQLFCWKDQTRADADQGRQEKPLSGRSPLRELSSVHQYKSLSGYITDCMGVGDRDCSF